jgi:Asp-tRNA(Asn)/Glu-tRNA(Gln) amidotransferase A subunit family amidase
MMAGADTVETVLGPLSTSLAGLKIFMKTIIDSEPWLEEPALIPMPWRPYSVPTDRPLRIGVLWHDGIVMPHPTITRALNLAVNGLRANDIEVVDFLPHLHDDAWAILAYRKEYAIHCNKYGIDALLCPVGPGTAPKHNTAKYWNYTSQWNLLDYPGLVFPVTTVDKDLDAWKGDEEILGELDQDNRKTWDPAEFHGTPAGLQLVGRRFDDEKIIGITEYLIAKVGGSFEKYK